MVAAFALEVEHRVNHVLDDARAGDLAILGDVADEDDRGARLLGVADQRLRRTAHLRNRAGSRIDHVGPQRLDRIDDQERGRALGGERRQHVLDAGLGREPHRRGAEIEAVGAQANLRRGLLAGDVDDGLARIGERAGDLQQQGRLADARIAADQQRRAADEAAAGDAVELGDARLCARRFVVGAGEGSKGDDAAPPDGAHRRPGADAGARRLLDERVPLAAILAAALPAVGADAAVLADELNLECRRARHGLPRCSCYVLREFGGRGNCSSGFPAKAEIQVAGLMLLMRFALGTWIPAFAGISGKEA